MRCPFCGGEDTQVKDSRPAEDNSSVRRRRECASCGGRFTTYERVQLRDLVVIKTSGKREDFDRDKLERSIRISMQKRPVDPERIDPEGFFPKDVERYLAFYKAAKPIEPGGTGMSPWRMMNEWGIPPVELHSLLYRYATRLADAGRPLPALTLAGGFTFEDHALHFYFLGGPDFVVGPTAPKAQRNILGVIGEVGVEAGKKAAAAVLELQRALLRALGEQGGSGASCEDLAAALGKRLGWPIPVELAMRYGQPSIKRGLESLRDQGVRQLLVLPMYPQFSGTTTASIYDAVDDALAGWLPGPRGGGGGGPLRRRRRHRVRRPVPR